MDQVEEVKSKVDLVEVISSYIPLKKMGRNMGGLCPFHGEKTPSFMVSGERQVWKCFGCQEGGDVFTFVEKIEGWDFREALEELAKRAGVKLVSKFSSEGGRVREKILEMNALALKFYSHVLNEHPLGGKARRYLESRGISSRLWQKFELGFAPSSWENVFNFLQKKGFSQSDIAISGLVVGREGDARQSRTSAFYDRFRDRIMFPIKDVRGKVVGFSGRVLEDVKRKAGNETRMEAKYINSPETPVFHKRDLLFGLDIAREAIRDKNEAILVEGEFDVLSSHKAGVENVVASKGTALTDKQVTTLARLCENVTLCFDTDVAGGAAARRGIELLDLAGVNIKVARLTSAKDPDEFAQKDPEGFRRAVKTASNIYDYLIDSVLSRHNATTSEGKKKIGQEILPVIAKISDDLARAHYVSKLAKSLDLDATFINEAISKRQDLNELTVSSEVQKIDGAGKNTQMLEDYFLALFLAGDQILNTICNKLESKDFEGEMQKRFWKVVRDIIGNPVSRKLKIKSSKPKRIAKLLQEIPKEFSDFVDHLYLVNISPKFGEREAWAQEILKVAWRLKKASISRQILEISSLLKEAQSLHNERKIFKLSEEFNKLSKTLKEEVL